MTEKSLNNFDLNSVERNDVINLSPDRLWELISNLDRIDAKARLSLGLKIGGCYSNNEEIDWNKFVKNIPEEDLKKILWAIGDLIDSPEA